MRFSQGSPATGVEGTELSVKNADTSKVCRGEKESSRRGVKNNEALIALEGKTKASPEFACERPFTDGENYKGYKIKLQIL
jgi:hypothetical protein